MIERYLTIKNFRSIGNEKREIMELNYLMNNEGSYGGLVTLIGENNSGKSNFLDALKSFQNRKFNSNDIPFNIYPQVSPRVSFVIHEKKSKTKIEVELNTSGLIYSKRVNGKILGDKPSLKIKNETKNFIKLLLEESFVKQVNQNPNRITVYNALKVIALKINDGNVITSNDINNFNSYINNPYILQLINQSYQKDKINDFVQDIKNNFVELNAKLIEQKLIEECVDVFGVKLIPNIITYIDNQKISTAHTVCNVQNGKISNTVFLTKLFDLLDGEEFSNLQDAYMQFNATGKQRKNILTNYARQLNKSVKKLSNLFNRIYSFNGNEKYSFRMLLESDYIYFMIDENGEDIVLDSQSTGFRWFFDFFFNVFADKALQNGDIVLLDEPATNLHVAGQIELRKQIKRFGELNGITFIMSTHSPFLIDPDYLDELRVVSKLDQQSKINNKFTVTDTSNVDVIMPIKTALTVNRHIILNPNDLLIFVEGITDYNYLIAFKELFELNSIRFMPIQGIKRNNLYNELLKITKNPILLVDSDGAGKYVYDKNKDKVGLEIFKLTDVDEKFHEIEDLFADSDKQRFNILDKDYKISSGFKNAVVAKKVRLHKDTKENFKKLLDHINT